MRVRFQRRLPQRTPVQWALAGAGSALVWTLLLTDTLAPRTAVGLLFAGGWTLSLLPVHASLRPLHRRRPAPPPPPAEPPGGPPGSAPDPDRGFSPSDPAPEPAPPQRPYRPPGSDTGPQLMPPAER